MKSIFGPSKFHSHHGSNIELACDSTAALRKTSFANALTFSCRALEPAEIFLVEIEENESGWSGHMRIGLTQLSPETQFELPLYALPDLVSIGKYLNIPVINLTKNPIFKCSKYNFLTICLGPSWLFAITKTHNNIFEAQAQQAAAQIDEPPPGNNLEEGGNANNDGGEDGRDLPEVNVGGPPGMAAIEQNLFNYRRIPRVITRNLL